MRYAWHRAGICMQGGQGKPSDRQEFANGKYYFYVTLDRKDKREHTIDVAVSDSPTGPFVPARKDGTIQFVPLTQEGLSNQPVPLRD